MTGAELQHEVAEVGGVPFRAEVARLHEPQRPRALPAGAARRRSTPSAGARRPAHAHGLRPAGPESDLRAIRGRLLEENVAGFYDERPGRKRLYAVSEDRTLTPAEPDHPLPRAAPRAAGPVRRHPRRAAARSATSTTGGWRS